MRKTYSLTSLNTLELDITKPSLVFLYGDLWAGKTTLCQKFINDLKQTDIKITSPTYVYYNKYGDIYHFDLYRMEEYDNFVSIGWEEILDNNEGVIFIEWPQILESYYTPDLKISISKAINDNERQINIEYL